MENVVSSECNKTSSRNRFSQKKSDGSHPSLYFNEAQIQR